MLIVGGKSTDSVLQAAKVLHKKSSHVIVIGYNDVDLRQVRVISSKPAMVGTNIIPYAVLC